jgi:hypothetical protein
MLLLKIAKFFEAFSDVSLADKMMMAQSLEADPKYRRKDGEHILELLERVDSKRKPAVVWNRFIWWGLPAYFRQVDFPTRLSHCDTPLFLTIPADN